jgi:aerobic C4-dicarboxylate transport protein
MTFPRLFPRNLTARVLIAIAIGIYIGAVWPATGVALRPLGDTFINLVKMVIAPIVFLTIVLGIANMADIGRVGRVGLKAFIYFTALTLLALAIGLVLVNVLQPGAGVDITAARGADITRYTDQGKALTWVEVLTHAVPSSVFDALARGDVLQVVVFSVLFGVALLGTGARAQPLIDVLERAQEVMFRVVAIIMIVAPIGALGAMAYTIGQFGLGALLPLIKLMGTVYLAMAIFILIALNTVAHIYGVRLLKLIRFIREEILLVLGTSSSEAALPRLIEKLERYGCSRSIVGLVVPAGYSFNLDGTAIYLVMATMFLAQASGVHLSIPQQLGVLGLLLITSKGAAGVTGSGFIVLASTLAAVKIIPLEGLALLLGVDRFMSEARAITNFIGNATATVIISRHEGAFDEARHEATFVGSAKSAAA